MKKFFARSLTKSLAVAAVAALSLAGLTQTASASSVTVWTTAALNLREAPTVHSGKIMTLPKHKKLQLVECEYDYYGDPTWCKTHVGHKWGWVSANHLTTRQPIVAKKIIVAPTYTPSHKSHGSSYSSSY